MLFDKTLHTLKIASRVRGPIKKRKVPICCCDTCHWERNWNQV